jgi:hypothetical protein
MLVLAANIKTTIVLVDEKRFRTLMQIGCEDP